ncbi:hypothetical protein [Streptomyces sp. NBC_01304]|uniref:hypothetical protein n=1 Tax=Streptomyces sp. NBC_01304 TaxID=2903818 RepID=UPI002E144782|nr:hypothetical protein OG430_41235 [Streptomyces sp. NBC_01304]
MTLHDMLPAPVVPNDTVEKAWPTRLWLGTISPDLDEQLLGRELRTSAASGCRDLEAETVLDSAQASAVFDGLALQIHTGPRGTVRLRVQVWSAGHRIPLTYGNAAWSAWCYLAVEGPGGDSRSGAICLHDPRAGCDLATVPGLPWGRALTLQAEPGLAVIAPGWLASSVLPVSTGHAVAVLLAHGEQG